MSWGPAKMYVLGLLKEKVTRAFTQNLEITFLSLLTLYILYIFFNDWTKFWLNSILWGSPFVTRLLILWELSLERKIFVNLCLLKTHLHNIELLSAWFIKALLRWGYQVALVGFDSIFRSLFSYNIRCHWSLSIIKFCWSRAKSFDLV